MLPLRDTVQSRSFPVVTWTLIALNVAVFLTLLSQGPRAEAWATALGVVPARLLGAHDPFEFVTLFTSMFLHGGWAHLLSNMTPSPLLEPAARSVVCWRRISSSFRLPA